jgi:hypothetical protein
MRTSPKNIPVDRVAIAIDGEREKVDWRREMVRVAGAGAF